MIQLGESYLFREGVVLKMPKRKQNMTNLEKYYWKVENIQKILQMDYAKNLLLAERYRGKIDVGSVQFAKIVNEFGIENYFSKKKNENVVDARENGVGSAMKKRPTYLLSKCIECRIVSGLRPEEKERFLKNYDKEELMQLILSEEEYDSQIGEKITDNEVKRLLHTRCRFTDKGGCEECQLSEIHKCSPQHLIDICQFFKEIRGKGKMAFSGVDLRDICSYFCKICPGGLNEKDYNSNFEKDNKQLWKNTSENSNLVATSILFYENKVGIQKRDKVNLRKELEEKFRVYYVKQFEDEDKIEMWFWKLVKNYSKSEYKRKNLEIQVERWYQLWMYSLIRYSELRKEEKSLQKEYMKTPKLYHLIEWEYMHQTKENISNIILQEEMLQNHEISVNAEKFCEDYEFNGVVKKAIKKIKKVAYTLFEFQKDKITQVEKEALGELIFWDLERVFYYMNLGWLRTQDCRLFTKNIIKEIWECENM